jgi:N-methylhydantoinase A
VLRVPVAGPGFRPEEVLRRFGARYAERFASELPEMRAMLVNVRTTVTGRRRPLDLRLFAPDGAAREVATPLEVRPVHFDGGWLETPIYRREELPAGASIAGPAVVEQLDTTVLIDPGVVGRVDRWGNLVIAV